MPLIKEKTIFYSLSILFVVIKRRLRLFRRNLKIKLFTQALLFQSATYINNKHHYPEDSQLDTLFFGYPEEGGIVRKNFYSRLPPFPILNLLNFPKFKEQCYGMYFPFTSQILPNYFLIFLTFFFELFKWFLLVKPAIFF